VQETDAADSPIQDENRARVVSKGSLRPIIALLKDRSLVPFVIPVLFNICFDYGMFNVQVHDSLC
jgi:hypothetical protein